MHCLFLDLASHQGLLAAVRQEGVVAFRPVDHRIGDHELLPLIEALLHEAGWTYADLTQIACVTGPGGFTSLRVAVTCANVLADQLKIPSVDVHLSDLYRARAQGADAYWLHSTKKDQLFARGNHWTEPTLLMVEDFRSAIVKQCPTLWMGELIPEHEKIIEHEGLVRCPLAETVTILPDFLSKLHFKRKPLEPWYGRGW